MYCTAADSKQGSGFIQYTGKSIKTNAKIIAKKCESFHSILLISNLSLVIVRFKFMCNRSAFTLDLVKFQERGSDFAVYRDFVYVRDIILRF